ncbi:soluble lamin-associated protein of 75 kDa-like isoform X1 [Myxocyprinus asiaticus]|uniref:soluble lamin-associated protein of 75 kDa-like isoform X1 n=2 Tax=Myxocyprinus asiaticus TaxID=70543 RepID=UPI002221E903|nr:soluble lamin-associated protein of 75 kDa-like isoform X1 [Myxocyprinus asiaticus]
MTKDRNGSCMAREWGVAFVLRKTTGMEFPVDLLVSGKHEDLESSAQIYMNKLLYSNPDNTQFLTLPSSRKVRISPANVGFVPLYGVNLRHKVLALFAPEDQFTAVALFLADEWHAVQDILKTSDPAREGLVKVRSVGERIVLYVLNRIIYRTVEMSSNEVPFLCHGEDDYAKILWKNGEAVGFYSVKSKGSLCNSFVSQCYLLPVMDSIFVRKDHRGNGHGLQMLEDFVDCFKDDELGLKYPLTQAMQKVCSQYLSTYPADADLFWEVEGVGGPYQKVKVASKLSSLALRWNHSSWAEEHSKNGEVANNKVQMTEESLDITEEVVVVKKHLKVAEVKLNEMPISKRTWSSERSQRKRLREEPEERAEEDRPEKINRLEEPETETDAVVPETKEPEDGESAGEQEDKANSVQVQEAVATETPAVEAEHECPVAEVNGEMSDVQEEKNEGESDTVEDALDQGRPLEEEAVVQNGTAEKEEMEVEGEKEAEETLVRKDDITDPLAESEKSAAVADQIDQEPITEEKQEAEVEITPADEEMEEEIAPAIEKEQEEEVAPAIEEEQAEEVAAAIEKEEEVAPAIEKEQEEEVAPAIEKEQEEEVATAIEEEQAEEVASAVEEEHEKDLPSAVEEEEEVTPAAENTKDTDQPTAVETSSEDLQADLSDGDSDAVGEPAHPELDAPEDKASGSPTVAGEREAVMDSEEPPLNQEIETASDVPLKAEVSQPAMEDKKKEEMEAGGQKNVVPEEEPEEDKQADTDEKDKQKEEENTFATEDEGKSSDEANDSSTDVRVLRGGRSKPVPPTPKRTSSRRSKAVIVEEIEGEMEEEEVEEEKLTSTEEEKGSTEEEEAEEHSTGEEDEPPVIDRRVLRSKTKVIKSTPRARAKRRSKI